MTSDVSRPLHAAVEIAAPAQAVWRVVSDVRRTGEWSPECRRVIPFGAVRAGCWLLGFNRRGAVRWAALSRVVRYRPDQEISWRVVTNGSVWTYRLRATATGTRLEETRHAPGGIGWFARWFIGAFLGGQAGHDRELEHGMAHGLERIRQIAEAPVPPASGGRQE